MSSRGLTTGSISNLKLYIILSFLTGSRGGAIVSDIFRFMSFPRRRESSKVKLFLKALL
ncbi:hypothetical protein [Rickettsia asembonensis]|uniref:hypothetical protein n=1 Tax=Rickettsia asembonensis TaxID=1068590 RepID=UPI001F5274FC|nr:hypothetical protein [Rickettsia asembonensis]